MHWTETVRIYRSFNVAHLEFVEEEEIRSNMPSIRDIAIEYGQQVEGLLERLGARGPVKGAGELLDQVKGLIDPEGLRKVRWFLKLRNKVVHNKPPEMPMPSPQEVERAGRAAVAVLEGVLAAQNATFPRVNSRRSVPKGIVPPPQQNETPGPVYRIREREGAYEFWVGPGGVWTVAERREALKLARREAEVRLVTRFPRLAVRGARRARGLEQRLRWGRKRLSPEEVLEVVRLLTGPPLGARSPLRPEGDRPPAPGCVRPSTPRPPSRGERVHRVRLDDVPATFYVGPAGVLVVADFPLIAQTEAKKIWEDSGGTIAAVPAVLDPRLKEAQGHTTGGVLALRDEGAIRDYLRGGYGLDEDEVDRVAGWLQNRLSPVPILRDKKGRYRLRGDEVTEGRTKAPPAFLVELVPPSAPPALSRMARGLSWRVAFLPELVMFAVGEVVQPVKWVVTGVLLLRFWATFGDLPLWKGWLLLVVGGLELAFVWDVLGENLQSLLQENLVRAGMFLLWYSIILIPGLLSLFRGVWVLWLRRWVLNFRSRRGRSPSGRSKLRTPMC